MHNQEIGLEKPQKYFSFFFWRKQLQIGLRKTVDERKKSSQASRLKFIKNLGGGTSNKLKIKLTKRLLVTMK